MLVSNLHTVLNPNNLQVRFKRYAEVLPVSESCTDKVMIGDLVLAESKFGINIGVVISESWTSAHTQHSGDILHVATAEERRQFRNKLLHEENVIDICKQVIASKDIMMDILDAEYQWNGEKLAVFFDSRK